MKPKLLLALTLVLSGALMRYSAAAHAEEAAATKSPPTNTEQSLESLLHAPFPGEKGGSRWTGNWVGTIQDLSPVDLNRIAVAAARELSLCTTNGDCISADTVDRVLYQPMSADTPTEAALRRLCMWNQQRMYLLRDMANRRQISDPGVIEPLIIMLDYPGTETLIRDEAAQILCQITGRECANLYQYSTGEKHEQLVRWWWDWWAKNKNGHPMFGDDLKQAIADRVSAIQKQIILEVKGYGGLAYGGLAAASVNRPDRENLMTIRVDSSLMQNAIPGSKEQIYLQISAHYETPRLPPNSEERHSYPAGVVGEWQPLGSHEKIKIEEVYHELLPGTDVAVTVDAASQDGAFPKLVRECLQRPPESIQPEIARLTEQLHDEQGSSRAARVLVQVGEYAPVIAALSSTNLSIQRSAIIGLADLNPNIKSSASVTIAVPPLIHLLKTSSSYTRYLAAWALGHVHAEDKASVDALIAAINDEDQQVRKAAIISLAEFKSQAHLIVPVLHKLADTHSEVSAEVTMALNELNPYLERAP
jgi:hypothetical protein